MEARADASGVTPGRSLITRTCSVTSAPSNARRPSSTRGRISSWLSPATVRRSRWYRRRRCSASSKANWAASPKRSPESSRKDCVSDIGAHPLVGTGPPMPVETRPGVRARGSPAAGVRDGASPSWARHYRSRGRRRAPVVGLPPSWHAGIWSAPDRLASLRAMTANWAGRAATVVLAGATSVALVAGPALAAGPVVGAPTAGDPYFPLQGNGGYDVGHYGLTLDYRPGSGQLTGMATIDATATQSLRRFDLDLRRTMTVSSVTVDGRRAVFAQPADLRQELVITPAARL